MKLWKLKIIIKYIIMKYKILKYIIMKYKILKYIIMKYIIILMYNVEHNNKII